MGWYLLAELMKNIASLEKYTIFDAFLNLGYSLQTLELNTPNNSGLLGKTKQPHSARHAETEHELFEHQLLCELNEIHGARSLDFSEKVGIFPVEQWALLCIIYSKPIAERKKLMHLNAFTMKCFGAVWVHAVEMVSVLAGRRCRWHHVGSPWNSHLIVQWPDVLLGLVEEFGCERVPLSVGGWWYQLPRHSED